MDYVLIIAYLYSIIFHLNTKIVALILFITGKGVPPAQTAHPDFI
jgi:hypothetical protein